MRSIDYHVHLTDDFTIDTAVNLAKQKNMKFGIVAHPPGGEDEEKNKALKEYIASCRKHDVYVGMQPMIMGWRKGFSESLLDELDYVLMDADTVPLGNDRYLEIWRHNNYIADIDEFMEIYMEHILNILQHEKISIFARPTYLPINFARYYDMLWTKEKITAIIDLASEKNIAFEISTPMHVPKKEFIQMSKEAGIKFALGTNARNHDAGELHYGIQMFKECALTEDDMLIL